MKIPTSAGADALENNREFLTGVIALIDHKFGTDYAKKNPSLVAALVQTAAYNLRTQIQSGVYGD